MICFEKWTLRTEMSTSGTYQVHQCAFPNAAQLKPQKLVRDGFAQNESNGNVNVKPTQRLLNQQQIKFIQN